MNTADAFVPDDDNISIVVVSFTMSSGREVTTTTGCFRFVPLLPFVVCSLRCRRLSGSAAVPMIISIGLIPNNVAFVVAVVSFQWGCPPERSNDNRLLSFAFVCFRCAVAAATFSISSRVTSDTVTNATPHTRKSARMTSTQRPTHARMPA